MDYKISNENMEEIKKRYKEISDREWLRLIFCELHEIKDLMKKR